MNLRHRFVILARLDKEPTDQYYVQVYLNDDFSYQVEYRDGSADQHFQAHIPAQRDVIGVRPVAEVMWGWAHERPRWREAVTWHPWLPS